MIKISTNKTEVISFRKRIGKGENITFAERVKSDGTIEGITARFYEGQELQLRIRPYVRHHADKIEDLMTYPSGTERYLSGNDDVFNLPVNIPVEYDDYVEIQVENVSTEYDYDLVVDVVVDYYGGRKRVIGGCM